MANLTEEQLDEFITKLAKTAKEEVQSLRYQRLKLVNPKPQY